MSNSTSSSAGIPRGGHANSVGLQRLKDTGTTASSPFSETTRTVEIVIRGTPCTSCVVFHVSVLRYLVRDPAFSNEVTSTCYQKSLLDTIATLDGLTHRPEADVITSEDLLPRADSTEENPRCIN
jgi:hypothetical protein